MQRISVPPKLFPAKTIRWFHIYSIRREFVAGVLTCRAMHYCSVTYHFSIIIPERQTTTPFSARKCCQRFLYFRWKFGKENCMHPFLSRCIRIRERESVCLRSVSSSIKMVEPNINKRGRHSNCTYYSCVWMCFASMELTAAMNLIFYVRQKINFILYKVRDPIK